MVQSIAQKNINKEEKLEKNFKIVVVAICFVLFLFKANTSSFNMYSLFLAQVPESESVTLGTERGIRSDEWGVVTPIQLYQAKNGFEKKSDFIGSEKTDISILGNMMPTKNILSIGKPFTWGYYLMGTEYGMAWYHIFKYMFLILFSFEFLKILTKKIKLSMIFSIIISFSPGIVWWFTTNAGVTEVFIYFEMIVVFIYYFFKADNKYKKALYSVLLIVSLTGFWNVIYPPLQVPLAYLLIFTLLGIYLNEKKELKFNKYDTLYILFTLSITGAILFNFYRTSKEAIELIMNTSYPGKRFITGGKYKLIEIMRYIFMPLLPYPMEKFSNYIDNLSRFSSFITLFPFPLIMYVKEYKKYKRNKVTTLYFIYILLCLFWFFIEFPLIVAKVTLMSYVPEVRLDIVLGFAMTIFLIMIISEVKVKFEKQSKKYLLFMPIIFTFLYLIALELNRNINYEILKILFITGLFTLLIYFLLLKKIRQFVILFFITGILSGLLIIPINFGTKSLERYFLHYELKIVDPKREATWATLDDLWISKYLLTQGYKSYNSLHFPPHNKLWEKIGMENKYYKIYNRYAHILLTLSEKEKKAELIQPDVVKITLTYEDLKKLRIKYLIKIGKMENEEKYNLKEIRHIPENNNMYIYEVKY